MASVEELRNFFEQVDDDKKQFAFDTIDEYVFFQEQIEKLKKMPQIEVSEKNPARQRLTPAAKLIKEYSQVIDAKRGTLLRILYRVESSAADELMQKLADYG